MSRIMLALKTLTAEQAPVSAAAQRTLVFDEVDAGIGGSAAVAVGRSLASLGERHQVLVVTHLAQVAALATTQIVVSKQVVDGVTIAEARSVDGDQRVDEIARMLSGDAGGASARQHAAELLSKSARSR